MKEVGPEHPIDYREEIVRPFFDRIQHADSFAVVGGGSMGKTRLLDFVTRTNVQQHYLQQKAAKILLLRTDCNRAAAISEWNLYELLMTAVVEGSDQSPDTRSKRIEINNSLRQPLYLAANNELLALRHLELAIRILTHDCDMQICFLLDEFDEMFEKLKAPALANLRAIRDANKNQLCYGLFFRHPSEKIRDVSDCEGFYELFSRRQMGLKPYTAKDSLRMLAQLEERHNRKISGTAETEIYQLSGGHPGLISALYDQTENGAINLLDEKQHPALVRQTGIQDECMKLWRSLNQDEQDGLMNFIKRNSLPVDARRWLEFKGLLVNDSGFMDLFSPIFRMWLEQR